MLLPSDTHRKPVTSITDVLLPFVTYLPSLPRTFLEFVEQILATDLYKKFIMMMAMMDGYVQPLCKTLIITPHNDPVIQGICATILVCSSFAPVTVSLTSCTCNTCAYLRYLVINLINSHIQNKPSETLFVK
jgi:hypothetical protein